MISSLKRPLFIIVFGAVCIGVGWLIHLPAGVGFSSELRLNSGTYTNPLLECDIAQGAINAEKQNFQDDLNTFVLNEEAAKRLDDTGVYFRDLNNGPSFGVNSSHEFVPASVLKVPVMMSYYKWAETTPGVLDQTIALTNANVLPAQLGDVPENEALTVGKTYTVEALINQMIRYSDNQALTLLFYKIPLDQQTALYSDVGIDPAIISDPNAQVSVKQVSAFFRILYNASFLTQADSEKALKLLTTTVYDDGLRAGVPNAIEIAHKFGVRPLDDGSTELHDCGIVYYPKHQYLLCVMTRGRSEDSLASAIKDISAFVYKEIDDQYGGK